MAGNAAPDPAAQLSVLIALYKQDIGVAPSLPADATEQRAYLEQALRQHISVTDDELHALAQQRAEVLQQALLAGADHIDPARVFLVENAKAKPEGASVRLELSLQ